MTENISEIPVLTKSKAGKFKITLRKKMRQKLLKLYTVTATTKKLSCVTALCLMKFHIRK